MANEPVNTNNEPNQNEPKTDPVDTKALEAKIKELESANEKLRQANTNASAEASKYKKAMQEKDDALKARMTEEEKAKAESDAANAAMQQELENLRKERNIAKYTGALVASDIGMDAETAKEVAEALNAGETDKVFDGIRKFIITHDKALREDALRGNKTLPGGNSTKVITHEEFKKMSLSEMMQLKAEHPDQFAELTKS